MPAIQTSHVSPDSAFLNVPIADWLTPQEVFSPFTSRNRVGIPLVGKEGHLGLLELGARSGGRPYTSMDFCLLQKVSEQVSLRLDNLLLSERLTQEISAREAYIAEQNAAIQANHAKSEFMARMSHELRNPLNAIIGYSELLTEEIDDLKQEDLLRDLGRITGAGKHLLTLINSILDIARIESGRLEIYCEPANIHTIVADAIALTLPLVEQNRNHLEKLVSSQSGYIVTDALKVRQILCNLLSNAAKFTRDGIIRVAVSPFIESGQETVRIAISDTGIGITKEQIAKLFQPYVQADASVQAAYGGSGLGLAICHSYCEALGGSISVESTPGAGSTFIVFLPRFGSTPSQEGAVYTVPPIALDQSSHRATLLVIDDDQLTSQRIKKDLVHKGVRVLSAYTHEQVLTFAQEQRPDLIVLDAPMTSVTGWEVLERLKSDPDLSRVPVIMLSICDERQKGLALGASAYLIKPAGRSELLTEIYRFLDLGQPQLQLGHEVLTAEDDQISYEALAGNLQKAGLTLRHPDVWTRHSK